MNPEISRRRFLGSLGIAGAGLAVGGVAGAAAAEAVQKDEATSVVPFYGPHQAGIATPAQDRIHIAAFDVVTDDVSALRDVFIAWTDAGASLTAGNPLTDPGVHPQAPPADTGEAEGLHAANLTITVGVGPTFFVKEGIDRFGLASKKPPAFSPLPAFPRDKLDSGRSDGDIVVQACADDPQVSFHAIRNFARIGRGTVAMRWSQMGFGRTASTSTSQTTPRNLFGMKDGTNNVKAEDDKAMAEAVWLSPADGPAWAAGGTYMACRRIRMLTEVWDRSPLAEQEETFGRSKQEGAPLGKQKEFDTVDLDMRNGDGEHTIATDAHIRLAAPGNNAGAQMLRRGYSFTDGMDAHTGQLDAGLFFISFQKDVNRQFVAVQQKLSASDRMNEYVEYTSSAVFLMLPGVNRGDYLGRALFA